MKVSTPIRLEDCFDPTATYLAGGTDLMVAINFGHERPEHVMSLRKVGELQALEVGDRVRVGGGVTYARLVEALGDRSPAMVQAARTVGSALVTRIGVGSGSTPSLITSTSISPTRSA